MVGIRSLALAAAAALPLLAGLAAEPQAGRIELDGTNVVSLGTYPNTEDRTATVKVRNAGGAALHLARVILTCKCMRVAGFPQVLGPGEAGEVAVTIAKNEVAGAFERVFYVESDDPACPCLKVRIVGNAKPLFLVTCDVKTALGPVEPGQVWTGRYTVAATEGGIRLGEPSVQNQGARCTFAVSTNAAEPLTYGVIQAVTFEGEGLLESAVVFPVVRADGQKAQPVRLVAEAVRRRPVRLVPDRLVVAPAAAPVRRRLLLSVESPEPLDAGRLEWESSPEGVVVRTSVARSGKALFVDVTFSPAVLERLAAAGGGRLTLNYGKGLAVDAAIQCGP